MQREFLAGRGGEAMLGHRYVMAVIIVVGLLAAPSFAAAVRIIGEEFAEVDIASGRFVFDGPVTVTDDTVTIRGTVDLSQ